MHVSFCYYCTIGIRISLTLIGTYEGGYTVYLRCVVTERWIFLYILLLIIKYYIRVKTLKPLKNYAIMLHLLSDGIPMLTLYS